MIYERSLRKTGEVMNLGETVYQITGIEGCGGSSVVYQAQYRDSLNREQTHQVLIKELFPWHPQGAIYRDEQGNICCIPAAEEVMEAGRRRYREGNQVNLELLKAHPAYVSGNINSYEAYGTYYTVLSFHGGESLADRLKESDASLSLRDLIQVFLKILTSLECFHKNHLLHLDISPENILLLPEQALLIDYNSVWHLDDIFSAQFMFSQRDGYSAPEIRLQQRGNIGFASDIYSLCAVFYRMLTGEILSEEEIVGNGLSGRILSGLPIFESVPRTAVYKTVQILRRGLHILPRKRYQTVDELRTDVKELVCRIEGSGVSHSALWESSCLLYRKQEKTVNPYLAQQLCLNGKMITAPELHVCLRQGGNILLTGSGGMGKTRFLKELWGQGMKNYHPRASVIYYIPLRNYQEQGGESGYIRNYILRHLHCGKEGSVEDALHELEQLFDRKGEGDVSLILLLDGLNEAGSRRGNLIREIEELGARGGIGLLVTERSGEVQEYGLRECCGAELLPLSPETVVEELESRRCPVPDQPGLQELLRIPMMLELYEKASLLETEGRDIIPGEPAAPLIQTPEELVERYLRQLLLYQLRLDSGNEAAQLCHRYILEHFLPSIGLKMEEKQSTLLTFDEIFDLAGESYRELHEEAFGKCFRRYLGKARKMFEGLENEAEWYDYAVEEQLIGKLRLLVKTEAGSYALFHDNLIPCLAGSGRENRFTIERGAQKGENAGGAGGGKLKRPAVLAAVVLAAAALTAIFLAAVKASGPAASSSESAEAGAAKTEAASENPAVAQARKDRYYQAAERILITANALNNQYEIQEEIIERTRQHISARPPETQEEYREFVESRMDGMVLNKRSDYEDHVVFLGGLDPQVTEELPEDFFGSPLEMKDMMEHLAQWLCSWTADSRYGTEQKEVFLKEYEDYLEAYRNKTFYEFEILASLLDDESRAYLLSAEALRYAPQFDDYYLNGRQGGQTVGELARRLESHLVSGNGSLEKLRTQLNNRMQATGGFELQTNPRKRIADDLAARLQEMDSASVLYDQALWAVKDYLEGARNQTDTQALLDQYAESLRQMEGEAAPHGLDSEMTALLKKDRIDPEEYTSITDEYQENLTGYRKDVERLLGYLKLARENETARRALSLEQETLWGMQEGFRRYYFCAVNYLFAGWDEKSVNYVLENVLAPLESLAVKELPWEKEKPLIEQKASAYLDECQEWSDRREQGMMELEGENQRGEQVEKGKEDLRW